MWFHSHCFEKPSYFEYSQFVLLSLQIYHCYVYSENNALNYRGTVFQEEHFYIVTYTGLLTNFYSFIPFSYKSGLVRTFKINNTWAGFHLDINNLTKALGRNLFPFNVIENVVIKFFNNNFTSDSSQSAACKVNCLSLK